MQYITCIISPSSVKGMSMEATKFQIFDALYLLPVLQRLGVAYNFWLLKLKTNKLLTFGVRKPATVGAKKPGIVPIVLVMPNNTPACLQQRSNTFA